MCWDCDLMVSFWVCHFPLLFLGTLSHESCSRTRVKWTRFRRTTRSVCLTRPTYPSPRTRIIWVSASTVRILTTTPGHTIHDHRRCCQTVQWMWQKRILVPTEITTRRRHSGNTAACITHLHGGVATLFVIPLALWLKCQSFKSALIFYGQVYYVVFWRLQIGECPICDGY